MSHKDLRSAIDLTAKAYSQKSKFGKKSVIIEGESFWATVINERDRVLVAFPGTASLNPSKSGIPFSRAVRQWFTNLTIAQTEVGRYAVHSGYLREADLMKNDLRTAVNDFGGMRKQVVFAGHSAGGAIAQLVASRLADQDEYEIDRVFAFSSPRVGDARFASRMKNIVVRFEYQNDLVPHLPLSSGLMDTALRWTSVLNQLVPQLTTRSAVKRLRESEYLHAGKLYWCSTTGWWTHTYPDENLLSHVARQLFAEENPYGLVQGFFPVQPAIRLASTLGVVRDSVDSGRPSFLIDHHITQGVGDGVGAEAFGE